MINIVLFAVVDLPTVGQAAATVAIGLARVTALSARACAPFPSTRQSQLIPVSTAHRRSRKRCARSRSL